MPIRQLPDPSQHPDWVTPHSRAWYAQMGREGGLYAYPWRSHIAEPSGETLFEQAVALHVAGQRVLDVGCGHGAFTRQWAAVAQEITGVDITDDFLATGEEDSPSNLRFVVADAKEGLPFADAAFDFGYTRRGPTSWYQEAGRVVRPGGVILGLHPGDGTWNELPDLFPGLFSPLPPGTPTLDHLQKALATSELEDVQIETVVTKEFLHAPADVLAAVRFGQKQTIRDWLQESCEEQVTEIFQRHATTEGLPLTFVRYLVRARVRG